MAGMGGERGEKFLNTPKSIDFCARLGILDLEWRSAGTMLNRRAIGKSSRTAKFCETVGVAIFAMFWIFFFLFIVSSFWETTRLKCQPQPKQIICTIEGDMLFGQHRRTTVPKAQLSGVKVIRKPGKKNIDRIVLSTIDRPEIPLNDGGGGEITIQLNEQVDRIQAFIADPQAQTLTVETHRNFPLSLLPLTLLVGFMLWRAGLQLKSIWSRF
jgi:hypothetical protein